jgi:uroporphyrinogen-III synthase
MRNEKARAGASAASAAAGRKPLFAITRMDAADDALAEAAEEMGYEVARLRLFETLPGSQVKELLSWLPGAPEGTALAWTSRRAATVLAEAALPEMHDALARLPLFAVGPDSAAPIASEGIAVTVPREAVGALNLATQLIGMAPQSGIKRVAFLHGDRALTELPDALAGAGISVERFEVYRTEYVGCDVSPLTDALAAERPCVVAFYSPSGVAGLERSLEPAVSEALHDRATVIARGQTTYQTLLKWGYHQALRPMGEPCEPFTECVKGALKAAAAGSAGAGSGGRPR